MNGRSDDDDGGAERPRRNKGRFSPGVSGNPRGRPRKSPRADEELTAFEDMVLQEADRPIRAGDRMMPVSQAVFRTMAATALKGSSQAQYHYMKIVNEVRRARAEKHDALLGFAWRLKSELDGLRMDWVGKGRAEQDLSVHPEDIVIDPVTQEVTCYLAITIEDRERRRRAINLRDAQQATITRSVMTVVLDDDDYLLRLGRDVAEMVFDETNALLPPRLRTKLKHRPSEEKRSEDLKIDKVVNAKVLEKAFLQIWENQLEGSELPGSPRTPEPSGG